MTPNLTRLFAEARKDPLACAELGMLLLDHGEALIAALEAILAADERGQGLPYAEAMQRAAKLLAQLEVEAHNG